MNSLFEAGVARQDITPAPGVRLTGYSVREGVSTGVDEPLTLTVLALRAGADTVLLVAVDLCVIDVSSATTLRVACADAAGIPLANVLVNVSHSHSTPGIGSYADFDTVEQLELIARFWRRMLEAVSTATREALASMQAARIAVGWGECHANINRRQRMPDGKVLLGEDPDGAADRSAGVIRIDALNGRPIAVAFRYSCHTVTLGPHTNRISPDFVGPARGVIERALCCPAVFLQGCAGNLNPITGIGQDSDRSPQVNEDKTRLGCMLGGEVIKTAQSLRTHRRRAAPRLIQSVAVYWLYEFENVSPGGAGRILARERALELPLPRFPAVAEIERERAEWADRLNAARAGKARESVAGPLVRFDHWAKRRLEAARAGVNPMKLSFPLQYIRVGGLRILALPFETMAETGMGLREALGTDTFVLGYSNGIVSYLPTPAVSAEGGMESKLAYKAYNVPAEIPGDWEPRIRRAFLEDLCHETT